MKQQNFGTPCPIMHEIFQLLATSKMLFLHGVSLQIVHVAHVDHSTPCCIHGWFSSCHPFVFVFSFAFYILFAFYEFLCLNLCYLFYQSLAQCCFCLFNNNNNMWMCAYLCMSGNSLLATRSLLCSACFLCFVCFLWVFYV